MKSLILNSFLFILLVSFCGAQQVESRKINIRPVVVSNGKGKGGGTLITSNGEYVVTARHIFLARGKYNISYMDESYTVIVREIIAVDGPENSDVVVALLGDVPTELAPLKWPFGEALSQAVQKGDFTLNIVPQSRTVLVNNEKHNSLAGWVEFSGQKVECLDAFLGRGSSGNGITNDEVDTFWVVSGEWPRPFLPETKRALNKPDATGFTLITGLSFGEIDSWRHKLVNQKK
jgi:hypothetical protein